MSDLAADLENWMTNLPQQLRTTPIIHLAIPGSHDSGTFDINPSSGVAPDAEPVEQILSAIGGCVVNEILTQWSITQYYTIRQQLYRGIRYLDFRIATKKNKDSYYFVHALYSAEVSVELLEVKSFIELHPKEIVFLDCQHFYGFEDYDHRRFMHLLTTIFGDKLLPYNQDMATITLESMTETNQYQVIVIYREGPLPVEPNFWPTSSLPNPWGNKIVAWNLIDYLTEQLKLRDSSLGYVSQCILTPSPSYILWHLCSNLQDRCFLPLEQPKYEWLNQQRPGPGGVNIIISDFVDYEGDEFATAVIELNQKLLDQNQNIVIDIEKK